MKNNGYGMLGTEALNDGQPDSAENMLFPSDRMLWSR
jgi:hypothetical protein